VPLPLLATHETEPRRAHEPRREAKAEAIEARRVVAPPVGVLGVCGWVWTRAGWAFGLRGCVRVRARDASVVGVVHACKGWCHDAAYIELGLI